MSQQDLLEKASDAIGGGATGVTKGADPVATGSVHANRKGDKDQGDKASEKLAGEVQDTDKQNNTAATGDASAKNKSTIATKPSAASSSMKEEIDGLFGDDLSEEFKLKATTIFEAAVAGRIAEERTALEEEFATKTTELEETFVKQKEELVEELSAQVSDYLDYVVEQWMEENQVAIDSSLNAQIAEEFIQKLKGLFEESYIQVPEEKVDVVEELAAKLEDMEEKLNSLVAENIELRSVAESKNQQDIFVEVSEGLALSQVEKFRTLAEGVDYDSAETYRKKLEIVKEQYFTEKKAASKTIEEQEMVELDEEVTPQAKAPAGPVSNYVSAIARTIKK
jgi:hypothetical protein